MSFSDSVCQGYDDAERSDGRRLDVEMRHGRSRVLPRTEHSSPLHLSRERQSDHRIFISYDARARANLLRETAQRDSPPGELSRAHSLRVDERQGGELYTGRHPERVRADFLRNRNLARQYPSLLSPRLYYCIPVKLPN